MQSPSEPSGSHVDEAEQECVLCEIEPLAPGETCDECGARSRKPIIRNLLSALLVFVALVACGGGEAGAHCDCEQEQQATTWSDGGCWLCPGNGGTVTESTDCDVSLLIEALELYRDGETLNLTSDANIGVDVISTIDITDDNSCYVLNDTGSVIFDSCCGEPCCSQGKDSPECLEKKAEKAIAKGEEAKKEAEREARDLKLQAAKARKRQEFDGRVLEMVARCQN